MKKLIALAVFYFAIKCFAVMTALFESYDSLRDRSPDIMVLRCVANPPTRIHSGDDCSINTFSAGIIATIKGTNHLGLVSLYSSQWLNQGDDYLIFGDCQKGVCQAIEDFRVIPLGRELMPGSIANAIANKPMNEQLQILVRRRLEDLNRQAKHEQEEKGRL